MNPALAAAALLFLAAVPAVAQSHQQMLVEEKTSTVVEVTSVYSFVPPSGYAPIRVKAVNNTSAELAVTVGTVAEAPNGFTGEHELESRFSFTAAAGKTTEREFLVPLCTTFQSARYSSPVLRANVQAGGISSGLRFNSGGYGSLPFTAFSTGLAAKTITDINNAADNASGSGYRSGDERFATLYDPAMLSADWRSYSGLDVLAMSSVEWTALAANIKSAVLQWVKLGGALNVYSPQGGEAFATLGIAVQGETEEGPDYGGTAYQLGNGRVCSVRWNGTALEARTAKDYGPSNTGKLRDTNVRRVEYGRALSMYEQGARGTPNSFTPIVKALGEKSFAAWQVGVILFIFGVVVGPVNLFYFAGKGRRHRLFFTTPIISLGAAALLLVVIFFQDGTGGTGHRASLVYLDSAENSAYIHQMQVSRTGVLFGSSFTLEDNAVLNMAVMPESRWTRLKGNNSGDEFNSYPYRGSRGSGRSEAQHYSVQDKNCGGDWFQSRSEQAQMVDAVQSTRGRIELKPGSSPPVVTSTITAPLERVFYVDGAGKCWASPGVVTTGAGVTLTEVPRDAFTGWRNAASTSLPKDLRETLRTHDAKEFFYASSSDARAGTVETLGSINWESSAVFLYGPLK